MPKPSLLLGKVTQARNLILKTVMLITPEGEGEIFVPKCNSLCWMQHTEDGRAPFLTNDHGLARDSLAGRAHHVSHPDFCPVHTL